MTCEIFFPNLWFDDELGGRSPQLSTSVQQAVAPISLAVPLLAGSPFTDTRRRIICITRDLPDHTPDALRHVEYMTSQQFARQADSSFRFSPWGWSSSARDTARQLGLQSVWASDPAAVTAINSRRFQAECESVLGEHGPPLSSHVCLSADDVDIAVREIVRQGYAAWVLKSEYSGSGRQRRIGNDAGLSEQDRQWLRRQIQLGNCILAEPLLDVISECGIQYWISSTAPEPSSNVSPGFACRLQGVTELLTTKAGQFVGSIAGPGNSLPDRWAPALAGGARVAQLAGECGYRGPLGIDCMMYRDVSGDLRIRVAHDVNGRQTMGRLALGCRGLTNPNSWLVWFSVSAAKAAAIRKTVCDIASPDVGFIPTSPQRISGREVTTSTAAIAGENLMDLMRVLHSHCEIRQKLPIAG